MSESGIARLADLPPGPALSALLYRFDPDQLTPEQAIPVLRAWPRQRAHDHARMARTLARVAALSRHAGGPVLGDWAGSEIAAALTWSDSKTGRELEFAETLATLPQVPAAFEAGRIDHGKAWVFTDVLGSTELTPAQIDTLCSTYVPQAPKLTDSAAATAAATSGEAGPATAAATSAPRGHLTDGPDAAPDLHLIDDPSDAGDPGDADAPDDADAPQEDVGGPAGRERARGGVPMGIEIAVGLLTLLGLDQRPGEIPGWGPVISEVARAVVARQHHARWRFAILDDTGHLVLAGTTRRRPHPDSSSGQGGLVQAEGGIVELHITATDLRRLTADHDLHPEWTPVIADLARRYTDRHRLLAALDAHPDTRLVRGALLRHIQIRDRGCVAPGCRRPARACDLDHTVAHAAGGTTTTDHVGPLCARHHALKHHGGWRLQQPTPGWFRWTSP